MKKKTHYTTTLLNNLFLKVILAFKSLKNSFNLSKLI